MIKIVHRLGGNITQPAVSDSEIEIEQKPDLENPDAEPILTVNTFDFAFPNADIIKAKVAAGADGSGVGIHEGFRYSISIDDGNGELEILDSYLLLSGAGVAWSNEFVRGLEIELRGKLESLSRRASKLTFFSLQARGKIVPSRDYIQIPYINSSIPDYKAAAIITLTGFLVVYQIRIMVQDTLKVTAEITSGLTAIAGTLKTIIVILGIIITIAAIIIFLFKIADQLIQPVKYHASMLWRNLLDIAAKDLGYTIESTIFDDPFINDTVILPPKFKSPEDKKILGSFGFTVPEETRTTGYYDGSFLDLLQDTKDTFRAFITITSDKRIIIEKIGSSTKEPAFRMNPKIKMDEYTTNASEIIANYNVSLLIDPSDENTSNNYEGTETTAITSPLRIDDKFAVTLSGEKNVIVPFSRGFIKTELTSIEKGLSAIIKVVAPAINALIIVANGVISLRNSVVSAISKLVKSLKVIGINIKYNPKTISPIGFVNTNLFDNRIGMLLLSTDFFTVAKVISLNISNTPRNTKLKSTNTSRWHSEYIYNKYHSGQSHVPSDEFPCGNQKREFKAIHPNVSKEGLELLIDNRRIFAPDGTEADLVSFRSKVRISEANIVYRIPYLETTNLKLELETPLRQ